jgi:hypothetical protein
MMIFHMLIGVTHDGAGGLSQFSKKTANATEAFLLYRCELSLLCRLWRPRHDEKAVETSL